MRNPAHLDNKEAYITETTYSAASVVGFPLDSKDGKIRGIGQENGSLRGELICLREELADNKTKLRNMTYEIRVRRETLGNLSD